MKELKQLPKFTTEKEEREFWEIHDSSEYLDLSRVQRAVFPNLKPSAVRRFPDN